MLELYAIARYDLHLSEAEFWDLSPSQFFALLDRFDAHHRREDVRFGLLATIVSSLFAKEGSEVTKPDEWFQSKNTGEMGEDKVSKVLTSFFSAKLDKDSRG